MIKNTEIRAKILLAHESGDLSISASARALQMSESGFKKLYSKYKKAGLDCLIHGLKGSNRPNRSNPDREQIINLYKQTYFDFNISHACEEIADREGINANRESLRRWLVESGQRRIKTIKPPHRERRERKESLGDLLQIDGSFEYWFGGIKTCLINIADDATGRFMGNFAEQETIESACLAAWRWITTYGIPKAFYADGRNMYHLISGREHNFFTNMCALLNIEVIKAGSPQAKGRVERGNGTHQDRLIPLMRLDGVKTIEQANEYIKDYESKFNDKFGVNARVVKPKIVLPEWVKSIEDLCWTEEARKLQNDWTVKYKGEILQVETDNIYAPAKSKINIRETIMGEMAITYRGRSMKWHKT